MWGGYLASLSNCTFGVYLLHILIMRHWLWNQRWIIEISNYPVQSLFVAFLTLVISFFICWLISFIPYSQWIIGYLNKQ